MIKEWFLCLMKTKHLKYEFNKVTSIKHVCEQICMKFNSEMKPLQLKITIKLKFMDVRITIINQKNKRKKKRKKERKRSNTAIE